MEHRQPQQVTLGPQYLLYKKRGNMMFNPSNLFNSKVKFTLIPYRNRNKQYVTTIVIPPQLNSEIFVSGSHSKNNLHIQIIWNRDVGREIEIIIGGMHKGEMSVFPLIKLKAPDNGKLMIPDRIIKLIPFKKFDKIVFSLIRRNEMILTNIYNLGKTYFTSQSINNTIINVQ